MTAYTAEAGQLLTLMMMAAALGMDAFSLGIGIGMRGIRLLDIMKISTVIGFFHIIMPLAGMLTGHFVGSLLGDIALIAGGVLLILLGGHMIYSGWRSDDDTISFDHTMFWGILLFALSVSIDSFSVGITMGLFASDIFLTVMLFGLFGGVLSIFGLLLGRKFAQSLGNAGEIVGGIILLVFGIKVLF